MKNAPSSVEKRVFDRVLESPELKIVDLTAVRTALHEVFEKQGPELASEEQMIQAVIDTLKADSFVSREGHAQRELNRLS